MILPETGTVDSLWPGRRFILGRAQCALWTAQQAIPDVPINAAQYVEIDGPVDVDEFVRHTSRSVQEGRYLQLRFEETEDGLIGIYDPSLHYWPDVVDLRGEADPRAVAEAMMREDYSRPLDPRVDRTARGYLFLLSDEKFLVYNRAHHLLTDGMGGKDRMVEALAAYTTGVKREPAPPPNPVDLDVPARADAKYRASSRFETDRTYWRDAMAGVGIGKTLAHREGRPEAVGHRAVAAIADRTMASLRAAAEQYSTILPTLIAASFGAYLTRAADGDEVIFQFPVAARTTKELRSTPLPVANTVPLRTHVTSNVSVRDAVKTTQSALMGALRHQRYRGEDIWADIASDEITGRTPRTSAQERSGPMLNLMLFDREFVVGDAKATFHILTVGLSDDLTINIYPAVGESGSDSLMVAFEANPNRYTQAEVEEHHRQFLAMLGTFSRALLEEPDRLVGDMEFAEGSGLDTSSPSGSGYSTSVVDVLDSRGHRVPAWMTGHIHIDGVDTGDLGHINGTTGELVVDHRLADQVVVDGVKVDLADLERAAREVEGVKAAVAVAGATGLDIGILADDNADRERLPAAVRRRANSVVPQVIWPDKIAVLDTIPTTADDAADRDATALLLATTRSAPKPYSAPNTPTEKAVAEAVTAVVGAERPSMDDELVQLGTTSLAFMQLAAHLGSSQQVTIGMQDLHDVITLRDLAAVIEQSTPARVSSNGVVRYQPTQAQRELWVINRAAQGALRDARRLAPQGSGDEQLDIVYHLPIHVTLSAGITADIVHAAHVDVATRHEALRTIYPDNAGEPIAVVRSVAEAAATAPITAAALDAAGIERAVATPFDLTVDAPWRAVIDSSDDTVELVLVAHHIAIDEWSLPIVLHDFSVAVQARAAGRAPAWDTEPIGFSATLAARDQSSASGGKLYWTRALRRAPEQLALPAPADPHTLGLTRGPAVYLRRTVDAAIRDAVSAQARGAHTTINSALCLALSTTLGDYTGADDIVLSMPVAGRETSDELHQVGMYVQTVPLRIKGVRSLPIVGALSRVGKSVSDAMKHAASAPTGLADVIVAYHTDQPDVSDLTVIDSGDTLPTYQARTALEFSIVNGPDGLAITLTVAEHHVDVVAAEHLLDRFVATVSAMADADDDALVIDLAPETAAPERRPRTTQPIDPITEILRYAETQPDAAAVVSAGTKVTYGELVSRARLLGDHLRDVGVRAGDRVALLVQDGSDAVIAMVATLMIDGVYVPIDPDNPQSRIDLLINATDPAAVVEDGLVVSAGRRLGVAEPILGGAYIIHTSGSTGQPKGVVVTRDNLAALLGAGLAVVDSAPEDVWSWVHSYTFDFSVWEIFAALASGGSVVAVDKATVRDPRLLAEVIHRHGVTVLSQTPTAFAALTDPTLVDPDALASVRTVVFGGEALDVEMLRGFVERRALRDAPSQARSLLRDREEAALLGDRGDVRLINGYGITETTIFLTTAEVDLDDRRSIIGAPLDGVSWAILDSRLRPVPAGAVGDLYVAGEQVSLGYLNAPALTAGRFVADPQGTGTRMYRTGDRVREIAPGRLAYLGRDDDQVQVRGHRIELGEIAAALRSVPGVGDVRVLVAPGRTPGDERLIAFVTEDGLADRDALRALSESALYEACAARLPSHAVPARISIVEGWPTTRTGKLDKEKLLARLDDSPDTTRPLTADEDTVAAVMRAVIGLDDATSILPDTNFFVAGGTSLSAARLAAGLAAEGHPVAVADIFDTPTVESLARLIAEPVSAEAVPLLGEHRDEPATLPLTPEQMDVWLRWRTEPDFVGYLMHAAVPVPATAETTRAAIATVIARHDALRTTFPTVDETPYQRRWGDAELAQHIGDELDGDVDLSGGVAAAASALRTPIDVAESLPWRIRVVEDDGATWLLVVVHHIAVDGESFAILWDELAAELAGAGAASIDVDYRQYTLWRHETLSGRRDELRAHWSSAFAEPVQPLNLPEVNLRGVADPAVGAAVVHQAHRTLSASVTAALDALAVERRTTAFVIAHTALAAVLARQADTSAVTIGTAVSGRLDARLATVPGLFARAVPLHTPIDLDLPFGELLARVTDVDLGAFAHADLPLTEIAEIADPGRAGAGTPLFEVSFGMVPDGLVELGDPSRRSHARSSGIGGGSLATRAADVGDVPLFGIDVSMYRADERVHLAMACTDRVADPRRLDALCRVVVDTLRAAVAAVDRPTRDLLTRPTPPPLPAPPIETLSDLLTIGLSRTDAVAVVDHRHHPAATGPELTNGQLDHYSTAIARALIARGIGQGDVVVQHLPRSMWNVIATVAVARTGAAFVNVDPADPDERRRGIITRSRPSAILTLAGDTPPPVDAEIPVLCIDEVAPAASTLFDIAERIRPLHPADPAYITFTSGTTGTPKGVVVTHQGLTGWARETVERLHLTTGDRLLHTYAVGFDAQLMGAVPARIVGATIVCCPPDVIAGDELRDTLRENRVTTMLTTPSVLATLESDELPDVRHIAVGGEPLGAGLVREWTSARSMSNEYGPTEATVAVSSARFTRAVDGAVPIGMPVDGVTAHVLDATLRPVPAYTVGELYLAGQCLARGYLDDPALTSSSFVADPAGTGSRMYRTGDLVHRRPDGTLVIHGRTDDQVKIRGIRLEPAEIDAALSRLPDVATSVTAVRATAGGEKLLVSWVVGEPGAVVRPNTVREQLSHVLPRSIIPSAIVPVTDLPIGRNGKVDVTRLVGPEVTVDDTAGVPLTGPAEETVAAVIAEVLDIPVAGVGADADFFELGGTSLSATRVTARLTSAMGADVPVRLLFEARSVRAIATAVDDLMLGGPVAPETLPIPDHLPLAHPQRRMWIHNHYDPMSTAYHVPVVIRIDGDIDIKRLDDAVDAVVDKHAVLRTVYPDGPAGPEQRIVAREGSVLGRRIVDSGAVRAVVDEFLSAPFDLQHEPGFRAAVISDESADERYFVASLHHIAIDGWSMRILLDDLLRAVDGRGLPAGSLTYADFTQWQMRRLGGPDDPRSRYTRELAHWKSTLEGAGDPVTIPGRRTVQSTPGRVSSRVDRSTADAIRATADGLSATVFHVAHAALANVLGQWTGRWDVVVGVPVHGRTAPEWESVVGMFVNTVALRTRLDAGNTVHATIEQARDVALTAADHAEVPYDAVARAVRPHAHDGYDPLISVLLVNEDVLPTISPDMMTVGADESWRASIVDALATVDAKFDIELVLADDGDGIAVTVVHSGFVPAEVAQGLLDDFVTVFAAVGRGVAGRFPSLAARAATDVVVEETSAEVEVEAADDEALTASVAAMIADVLDVRGVVGERDDFFTIGGTSLSATRVVSALGRELGVRVPTRMLFENPTPVELARAVGTLRDARSFVAGSSGTGGGAVARDLGTVGEKVGTVGGDGAPAPEERAGGDGAPVPEERAGERHEGAGAPRELPLAPTQRRMWVTAQLLGDVPIYAVPVIVPVPAGASREQVRDAVDVVVDRHPALRTMFVAAADGPRQRVLDDWRPELTVLASDDLTADAALETFSAPFDLEAGPPVRAWTIESDGTPTAAVIVAHHIVFDGESAVIVGDELAALLGNSALTDPGVGFDVVAERMVLEQAQSSQEQLEFWTQALDGYSGRLDLVPRRPAERDLRTATMDVEIGGEVSGQIASVAHAAHASAFHVLHAGVALALAIQSGTDDVAVATPVSLRRDADSARTVGMLISTVVLRTQLESELTVGGLLESVRDGDLAAIDHGLIAFDDVVSLVDPPREPGRHPLVQIAFSMGAADGSIPAAMVEPGAALADERSEFDLHVVAVDDGGTWRLRLTYARDLFDESMIRVIGDRMRAAVEVVVGDAGRSLASVDLLTPGEREFVERAAGGGPFETLASSLLGDREADAGSLLGDREADEDSVLGDREADGTDRGEGLLSDILASAVAWYPGRTALDDGRRQLTYREFDDWVSLAARTLRTRGLGADSVVAVVIPRSIESVVALWAVSRIGGVCVPVDVTYPAARLEQIVAATRATLIMPDDLPPQPADAVVPEPITRVSPDALAYIITTSGTTGTPNIVGVPHRGLHRVAELGDVVGDDRVAMAISPGFDATFHDMLLPLATGATLVVVPAAVSGGRDLTGFLRDRGVTVFTATPSVMRTLDADDIASLRLVYIGGEALTADLAGAWSRVAQVINIYGPTETSVTVSTGRYTEGGDVRIGRPRPGIGALVLDPMLRPVPPGVVGELYVAGTGVARGYLGDPALTSASFIARPDGRRCYRTGDLVRWDPGTGELVYVGRADRQVKIRGQRVEPAEIDTVLMNAGANRAATVLRDGPIGPALVSYVVSPASSTDVLLRACRALLPRHMVPSRIVLVPELPLTGAGKLDEKQLPLPEWSRSRRAPATPAEQSVVEAFEAVLGVEIGMDDDFFAAGGNSLALLSLRDELSRRTGITVSAPQLFSHPTAHEMAELIAAPGTVSGDRVVRLSPSEVSDGQPVWCVHTAAGVVEQFRPLADALVSAPVLGLQLPELLDPSRDMPNTLSELAARHVAALRAVQPNGPYRLVGWSLGGVIAHEIARQLVEAGEEVALLVLLDPRTPATLSGVPDDELREQHPLRAAAEQRDPESVRRFDERSATMTQAARSYDLRPVPVGKVLYVAARENPDPHAWGRTVGGRVEVVDVDATHALLGDPGVMGRIARVVEEEL
ncbi:amino acid adenylation domain-containing protein [Gordonia sp. ABSL11-1]|uniref:non-ribosomal peptide synthetase n=1 Tax=Gordonia sp. ABSL11-1 TaxID=3053924 RepID=UPI0025748715|nr:non-ribosomal peptide synthetase [Gordonia sp. ABSL11-1]MDL9948870.1 amino acid adenylation domain-containing protein [Gordonia sp. ABSL11-1]